MYIYIRYIYICIYIICTYIYMYKPYALHLNLHFSPFFAYFLFIVKRPHPKQANQDHNGLMPCASSILVILVS